MSDIIWGDPIEVNGKRPEWLEDGVCWQWKVDHRWFDAQCMLDAYPWGTPGWRVTYIRLPADHPHYAKPDDWQPCERTVRACIEAMPKAEWPAPDTHFAARYHGYDMCREALEALLPKPDPAEALVKEYSTTEQCREWETDPQEAGLLVFTRWLINTGRLRT